MFQLQNIDKAFRDRDEVIHVARNLSWKLAPGAKTALMGESGAGKTTIMNIIAGLDSVDNGSVTVNGINLSSVSDRELTDYRRTHLGLIFQKFHLVPTLDVWDNAALQARLAGCFDIEAAESLLNKLEIHHLINRYPSQLSGGQQQRVAIARALMHRPKLVLADEPTGNLDEATSDKVVELLVDTASSVGASLVVVTHSHKVASHLSECWHLASGTLTPSA